MSSEQVTKEMKDYARRIWMQKGSRTETATIEDVADMIFDIATIIERAGQVSPPESRPRNKK
jgi:hypothetical protein